MKRLECKSIDLWSVFRLIGGMSFVVGFVIALFSGGFANSEIKNQLESLPYIGTLMNGFVGALIMGLLAALLTGLCGVFSAVLYNIFAMIVGGIEIEIQEKG